MGRKPRRGFNNTWKRSVLWSRWSWETGNLKCSSIEWRLVTVCVPPPAPVKSIRIVFLVWRRLWSTSGCRAKRTWASRKAMVARPDVPLAPLLLLQLPPEEEDVDPAAAPVALAVPPSVVGCTSQTWFKQEKRENKNQSDDNLISSELTSMSYSTKKLH